MIATISKQAGRRYPQFGGPILTGAWPLRLTGTSATVTRGIAGEGWTHPGGNEGWKYPDPVLGWTHPGGNEGWTYPEEE